jgi:hypothetical protein
MTFVLAVARKKSIWMLTDRRLTFERKAPRDDAVKQVALETSDGVALLGYCGLGITAKGTEPSAWVRRALRGQNLPLEQALGVLADAARAELPRHLDMISGFVPPAHSMVVAAFIAGEPRVYSIDLARPKGQTDYKFRYTRHVTEHQTPGGPVPPWLAIAGSGAVAYLARPRDWEDRLSVVLTAHDDGRIPPVAVAKYLAKLNQAISAREATVSPSCIVTWRLGGVGGGGHGMFTGNQQEPHCPAIPTIARGMDLGAIIGAMLPHVLPNLQAMMKGEQPALNVPAINEDLAKLPRHPDKKLD